jgi:hypothetical protein
MGTCVSADAEMTSAAAPSAPPAPAMTESESAAPAVAAVSTTFSTPSTALLAGEPSQSITKMCELCNSQIHWSDFQLHQRRCAGDHQSCAACGEHILKRHLQDHQPDCIRRLQEQEDLDIAAMAAERVDLRRAGVLKDAQLKALEYVATNAQTLSAAAEPSVIGRLRTMGYDEHHLRSVKRFIRGHAPLIIHVNLAIRQALLNDTHYRNQFETGTSCGTLSASGRTQCEAQLFNSCYTAATIATHRVKYGALCWHVDPSGVASAIGYGNSYLLLNEQMRARVTIAPCDTLGAMPLLGVCQLHRAGSRWVCV